jgi:hypothetical protein
LNPENAHLERKDEFSNRELDFLETAKESSKQLERSRGINSKKENISKEQKPESKSAKRVKVKPPSTPETKERNRQQQFKRLAKQLQSSGIINGLLEDMKLSLAPSAIKEAKLVQISEVKSKFQGIE